MDRANGAGPADPAGGAKAAGLGAVTGSAGPWADTAPGESAVAVVPAVPRGPEVPGEPALPGLPTATCRVREVLGRIGDKWSIFIIIRLGNGPQRFTTLKRSVDGISQRMLTVTLRGLERDGIVSRTMYPVMPPRVDYALTPLGHTLLDAVGALMAWADEHLAEVDAAREGYDARSPDGAAEGPGPAANGFPAAGARPRPLR
jgi:DNA-binding HxlR family transcriptional regulator